MAKKAKAAGVITEEDVFSFLRINAGLAFRKKSGLWRGRNRFLPSIQINCLLPPKRGFSLAHARQTGQSVSRGKDLVQVDQFQLNGFGKG